MFYFQFSQFSRIFCSRASGASNIAYWTANLIFDLTLIGVYIFLFAAVLAMFCPSTYTYDGYGNILLPGICFTIASVFRFYSFSYLIADIKLAQSLYFYGSIAVVFILIDIWFTILFTSAKGNVTNTSVQIISYIFAVLDPTFGWYVIILYQNNFLGILTQNTGSDFFSSDVAGTVLVCMIGSCVLYIFIFVFITENAFGYVLQQIVSTVFRSSSVSSHMKVKPMMSLQEEEEYSNLLAITTSTATANADANVDNARPGSFPRQRSTGCVDPDVVIEKEKVSQIVERGVLHPKKSAILVHDLRKVYFARGNVPAKVAVKNINITIPQGEIFGLLGANGAGKTTLLKMVSGQELPSSGFALINGYDVVTHTSQAQRSMGLCPQFDTLLERLSVRENLLFFGTMKGVSQKEVVSVVEAFMQAMSIKRYENKLIQQLSGGNRRKVSLAVALMGSPPTVYLDEVSIAVFGDHFL